MSPSAEHTGLRSTALAVVGAVLVVLGLVLTFASHDLGVPDRAVPVSSSRAHEDSRSCSDGADHADALLASLERLFGLTPSSHGWGVLHTSDRDRPGCS